MDIITALSSKKSRTSSWKTIYDDICRFFILNENNLIEEKDYNNDNNDANVDLNIMKKSSKKSAKIKIPPKRKTKDITKSIIKKKISISINNDDFNENGKIDYYSFCMSDHMKKLIIPNYPKIKGTINKYTIEIDRIKNGFELFDRFRDNYIRMIMMYTLYTVANSVDSTEHVTFYDHDTDFTISFPKENLLMSAFYGINMTGMLMVGKLNRNILDQCYEKVKNNIINQYEDEYHEKIFGYIADKDNRRNRDGRYTIEHHYSENCYLKNQINNDNSEEENNVSSVKLPGSRSIKHPDAKNNDDGDKFNVSGIDAKKTSSSDSDNDSVFNDGKVTVEKAVKKIAVKKAAVKKAAVKKAAVKKAAVKKAAVKKAAVKYNDDDKNDNDDDKNDNDSTSNDDDDLDSNSNSDFVPEESCEELYKRIKGEKDKISQQIVSNGHKYPCCSYVQIYEGMIMELCTDKTHKGAHACFGDCDENFIKIQTVKKLEHRQIFDFNRFVTNTIQKDKNNFEVSFDPIFNPEYKHASHSDMGNSEVITDVTNVYDHINYATSMKINIKKDKIRKNIVMTVEYVGINYF